jgi:hypothetical protein
MFGIKPTKAASIGQPVQAQQPYDGCNVLSQNRALTAKMSAFGHIRKKISPTAPPPPHFSISLTQLLQLAAKSARRADDSPQKGFVGVNPDQNATHFASAEGKFCYCKIWVNTTLAPFFLSIFEKKHLKQLILLFLLTGGALAGRAQKVDSIYVNLYTDSLKKGTHNYINVDGQLRNGRYLPLDTTHLLFEASAGRFVGNSLWIDRQFADEKVHIKVTLRSNRAVYKEFDMYIKTKEDNAHLKTAEEVLNDMQRGGKQKNKKGQ